MSHSLTKIWIHLVFGTKEREPLINESFEKKLFEHIKQIIENDFKSLVTAINGTSDHIHILLLQNQNEFTNLKFAWQTGYGAFSVSESMIEDVKKYILNQKEHHRKISFAEEYKKFEGKYGLVTENR